VKETPFYIIGEVTGDHRFTFEDPVNKKRPIDLELIDMFGKPPKTILDDKTVSIDFDNVGLTMSAILLGEDVRNKTAKLSFGCYGTMGMVWDSGIEWDAEIQWLEGTTIIGVVDLFQGIISDWNLSETMAQMTIVNEFILWKKKTLRIAQAACPWDFKGTECTYSGGETWCDKSYERCTALSNTDNFGGFRFLPSIAEKSIWWGRVQG